VCACACARALVRALGLGFTRRAEMHLGAQLSRRQTLSEVFLPLVWFCLLVVRFCFFVQAVVRKALEQSCDCVTLRLLDTVVR